MQVSPYHPSTAGAPKHGAQHHPKLLPQGRCMGHKQEVREGGAGDSGGHAHRPGQGSRAPESMQSPIAASFPAAQ